MHLAHEDMRLTRSRATARAPQRGMSIIELMVGVAVGLVVVTGAVKLMSDTLSSNRRLLLETRVHQDLRAATDLIARDIRRAGYWQNAASGIFTTTGASVTANPYAAVSVADNVIGYQYARDADNTVQDAERAGFRLQGGALQFRNGASEWQPMTEPGVVTITAFTVTPVDPPRVVELYSYCSCLTKLTCTASEFQSGGTYFEPTDPSIPRRPTMTIREYQIVVKGQAANDATVQREIREAVRVRNDQLDGSCPAV